MKPLKLKIDGLNSFANSQTIDFKELSRYGFFGIFGPTGSGKSTVVDAITLSLYGEIPRFDGERGFGEFINNNKDTAYVYFEFEISCANGNNIYVVERNFKKTDSSIKTNDVRLIELVGDKGKILADKKTDVDKMIIDIVGLTYSDFTRTVVLPQGKFSEFLLLANKERRYMLERIFKLEKYGKSLSKKINTSLGEVKTELQIIESNLEIYGDVKLEDIEENNKLNSQESKELVKLKIKHSNLKDEDLKLSTLKKEVEEHKTFTQTLEELNSKIDKIERAEIRLDRGKEANILKPLLNKFFNNENKIVDNITKLEEKNKIHTETKKETESLIASYDELLIQVTEKLPSYQEQLFELKNAIHIKNENNVFLEEKDLLDENLKKLLDEKKSLDQNLINQNKMFVDKKQTLNNLKKSKESLIIQTSFISNVNEGYNLLTNLIKENKELISLIHKKNTYSQNIKDDNKKLDLLLKSSEDNQKEISKIEKDLFELIRNKINISETFNFQEEIKVKEMLHSKLLSSKNELDNASTKLLKIEENIFATNKNVNFVRDENESIAYKLDKINDDIKKFKQQHLIMELTKTLKDGKPCPVCGSTEHFIQKTKLPEEIYINVNEKMELEKLYNENFIIFEEASNELKILLNNKSNLLKIINKTKEDIGEYDFEKENINNLQLKSKYEEMKRTISSQSKNKDNLELKLSKSKDNLSKINMELATLNEGIRKEKKSLDEIKKDVSSYKNKLDTLKNNLNNLSTKLGFEKNNFSKFIFWMKKISGNSSELKTISDDENKHSKIIEEVSLQIESSNFEIINIEKKINKIKINLENLEKNINENNNKIFEIAGGVDPVTKVDNINQKIDTIKKDETFYKDKVSKKQKELQNLSTSIMALEKGNKILFDISFDLETEIKEKLKKSNFISADDVFKSTITEETKDKLLKTIKLFYEKQTKLKENINQLEKKLKNINVDELQEKITTTQSEIEILNNLITEKTESIAILKANNIQLEKNFAEIEKLLLSKKDLDNKKDLLDDLASLFSGAKFVEFLSKKQLRYITKEASERLKEMSHGRYALELKDTDFIIRDDYNGGIKRSPKTLSGGETFITSLCLALALSSKVQLNNANPLEFFFLDEGFGTLDLESLDLVITSLEKLRDENLIIGVISHSEELMSRIPIKLLIDPVDQFGSGSTIRIDNINI